LCGFGDNDRRHFLKKLKNFNDLSPVGGQSASACQISSKSVKRLLRYGDLTVFKNGDLRHFGFVKFEFFNGRSTKFYKDRSKHYEDIAIFVIFQDGGRRPLGF